MISALETFVVSKKFQHDPKYIRSPPQCPNIRGSNLAARTPFRAALLSALAFTAAVVATTTASFLCLFFFSASATAFVAAYCTQQLQTHTNLSSMHIMIAEHLIFHITSLHIQTSITRFRAEGNHMVTKRQKGENEAG
jgi:hypothetical protein